MQIKAGNNENQMINTNLQTQEKAAGAGSRRAEKQQRKNTIFAGELPINKDPIVLRRQQAQKKAMKFVMDAWGGERKMDQGQDEIRALQKQQWDEQSENLDLAKNCTNRMENLRQQYGVDMDSEEQKDLELMMKASSGSVEYLSEEEKARLDELADVPRTEYQQKCLEIAGEKRMFEARAENAGSYAQYLQSSLTDMKIERLKYHKMADAKEDADKVMEQASEEIQGLLWEEAKDHVDETYEEQREEAKEEAEEKEELEEKVEQRKEQKELIEERVETAQENSREAEKAQREQEKDAREEAQLLKEMAQAGMDVAGANDTVKAQIKDMLNKLKLVEADIKGIEIDEEL